jgi:hypothetical protein
MTEDTGDSAVTTANPSNFSPVDADHLEQERRRIDELIARSSRGDAGALPELRTLLDERPDLVAASSDLAGRVETSWVDLIAGSDLVLRESIFRRLDAMESELLAAGDSLVERLLATRVLTSWLVTHYCEQSLAHAARNAPARVGEMQRRLDGANVQFARAAKSLVELRRLMGRKTKKPAAPNEQPLPAAPQSDQ